MTMPLFQGLGLMAARGGLGADSMSAVSLTGSLDPNAAAYVAAVGGTPASGGAALTAANNGIDADQAAAVGLQGWSHQVLFCDWGDSANCGTNDGGYETAAVVYSDIAAPTQVPFDTNLAAMIASDTARPWFTLSVTAAGATGTTSVPIRCCCCYGNRSDNEQCDQRRLPGAIAESGREYRHGRRLRRNLLRRAGQVPVHHRPLRPDQDRLQW